MMHPSTTVSYELARARIADLHHQARRESLARVARSAPQSRPSRGSGHLRLRLVHRRRVTTAIG